MSPLRGGLLISCTLVLMFSLICLALFPLTPNYRAPMHKLVYNLKFHCSRGYSVSGTVLEFVGFFILNSLFILTPGFLSKASVHLEMQQTKYPLPPNKITFFAALFALSKDLIRCTGWLMGAFKRGKGAPRRPLRCTSLQTLMGWKRHSGLGGAGSLLGVWLIPLLWGREELWRQKLKPWDWLPRFQIPLKIDSQMYTQGAPTPAQFLEVEQVSKSHL